MQMELELRDYIQIIRKRIWLIVATVLLCSLAAGVFSVFFIDPTYEASTKIIVNRTASEAQPNNLDLNEINSNLSLINTYKEIIKTPAVMDAVVQQYPQFNMTADELIKQVSVSSVNNTQVMTLVVQDGSYRKAAEIVNAVSQVFKEQIPSIFKVENVSILNLANLEPKVAPGPVKPNTVLNIAIAFVVSLVVAVGIALLLEYLDDSVKTEADVKRLLGVPVIGQIIRLDTEELQESTATKSISKAGEMNHVQVGK
ncbi:capsular polysaccharide biosynthesis protein [Paenibacillus methanolicus]|uniref:Capsular polysaccharide biosynthesis protein n=2 Tax=Paenibacillus methanolicus TaxID=582686 RepID=A0A5S5C8N5_9BACL|nr:capsular polysaccharide biosynthesis protein [Paenibacillus methanolicus]